jgi:hypothetical protein
MIIVMKKNANRKEINLIIKNLKPKKSYLSRLNGQQIIVVN